MPETPKKKPDKPNEPDWADDQRERGYYYDDAHGYETYDPETDRDGENVGTNKKPGSDDPACSS
jgi:hypothetical protein